MWNKKIKIQFNKPDEHKKRSALEFYSLCELRHPLKIIKSSNFKKTNILKYWNGIP